MTGTEANQAASSTDQPASQSATAAAPSSSDQNAASSSSDQNAAAAAGNETAQNNAAAGNLPQTASPLPLLGLLGLGSLAAGLVSRRKK